MRSHNRFFMEKYCIFYKYLDRQAVADIVDPDETLQNVVSDQGLHCLPLIQQFLDTVMGSKLYWFKI